MNNIYLYGAGTLILDIIKELRTDYSIIGILDSNRSKWGQIVRGYPVLGDADYLKGKEYDKVIVSGIRYEEIKDFLVQKGVPREKISTSYVRMYLKARELFVEDFAIMLEQKTNVNYSVAEGGVYKGDFSKIINRAFPNSKLYLFDTFEGFDNKDIKFEEEKGHSKAENHHYFKNTSVDIVMDKLPYPSNAVICKGYFPDTTKNIPEQHYGFVNLDFDLYNPILEGLRYFYPRMISGGVILVHDYFNELFTGVKKAVDKFINELDKTIKLFPIGDHLSVVIIKE